MRARQLSLCIVLRPKRTHLRHVHTPSWGPQLPLTATLLWQTLSTHNTVTVALPLDSIHVQKEGEQVKWGYMAFYNRTPNLLLLEHVKDTVFYFLCGGIGRKGAAKKK